MIKKLQTNPFYLLSIPLFFLLHAIQENVDIINLVTPLRLFATYCIMIVAIYAIVYLFLRDHTKSSLITALWILFFFFYSAFHEMLKSYSPIDFFSRYVFVLPFSIVLLTISFVYINKTTKRFERFSLLLNILFIIYIILDLCLLVSHSFTSRKDKLSLSEFPEYVNATIPDTCKKPDIYFLLFDEYSGSESLKQKYGFHNQLDDYLVNKGFHIQSGSRSNYNLTGFSMASILNMSYLKDFKNVKVAT